MRALLFPSARRARAGQVSLPAGERRLADPPGARLHALRRPRLLPTERLVPAGSPPGCGRRVEHGRFPRFVRAAEGSTTARQARGIPALRPRSGDFLRELTEGTAT